MLPSFLITFREVIEASLIVATILGILSKLNQTKSIKIVWLATALAGFLSVILIGTGSLTGLQLQKMYAGKIEQTTEGVLMITSAVFITWAVFFLHKHFSRYKIELLKKVKDSLEGAEQKGLFILVFTAVFREGFEIVLFLSTIYFSTNPQQIFAGFGAGLLSGLLVATALFAATLRLPVFYAFRATSVFLILFAAGLLSRGVHEFAEAGYISQIGMVNLAFIPHGSGIASEMIKTIFGLTKTMDLIQISFYLTYISAMVWWVFIRSRKLTLEA